MRYACEMRTIFHWNSDYDPRNFEGKSHVQPDQVIKAVIAYLRAGQTQKPHGDATSCRICRMKLGSTTRTDGTFIWPDQTEHYIIAHQVWTPEHELLANMAVYKVPPPPPPPASVPMDHDINPSIFNAEARETVLDFDLDLSALDALIPTEDTSSDIATDPEPGALDALLASPEPSRPIREPRPLLDPTNEATQLTRYNGASQQEADPVQTIRVEYGAVTDPAAAIASAYPKAGIALAHKIVAVANHIGAHPFDLANLINFESGLTFRSDIQHPSSGATGLIQFYPGYTKKRLGVTTADLAKLTPLAQMGWVQTYFDKVRNNKDLDTTQKVAMAVFYPVAIGWASTKAFPKKVQAANRGIETPADYVRFMMRSAKLNPDQAVVEAPGLFAQAQQWWSSLWGPGEAVSAPIPAVAPSSAPGTSANTPIWKIKDVPGARLVDVSGRSHSPGPVPAGSYSLEQWTGSSWVPATATRLTLRTGHDYLLSAPHGTLEWGERIAP